MKRHYLLLAAIFALALFLRLYKLTHYPISIYWDEATIGYNAYSIAETGRDEYGTLMPLQFRSFQDYKMPGYIYTTAALTKIFGLNEFSVRITSSIIGSLTVLLTYFLVREISQRNSISFMSSLLLAISPWHLNFSRAGFESNTGPFFVVLGLWLFLRGLRLYKSLVPAIVILSISFYFYHSLVIFLPLFMLIVVVTNWRKLWTFGIQKLCIYSLLGALLVFPMFWAFVSKGVHIRAQQVNIISNAQDEVYQVALIAQEKGGGIVNKILYNRRLVYAKIFARNYLAHFGPTFLFISGDANPRHGPRDMGLLYYWEIPFFYLGIFLMLKRMKTFAIPLSWLLLAPIPAAISIPSPHALRSLNILPMPQLCTALGLGFIIFQTIKHQMLRKFFIGLFCIILSVSVFAYLTNYYTHSAYVSASDWGDGYEQLIDYTKTQEEKYEKIIVSGHYWKPYIYYAFFKPFPPHEFQKSGDEWHFQEYIFGRTRWGVGEHELDEEDLRELAGTDNFLTALSPIEHTAHAAILTPITEINDHNGEVKFIISEYNLRN